MNQSKYGLIEAQIDIDFDHNFYHIETVKMELYFTQPENIGSKEAVFDEFESGHIIKTMRKKSGATFHFTDGKGGVFAARISSVKSPLRVEYQKIRQHQWPPPIISTLAIGFIKQTRMDILIEKATELGITRFLLFPSRYSNFNTNNTTRWKKIGRQAIKQSLRFYLPEIIILPNLQKLLMSTTGIHHKYIAHQDSRAYFANLIRRIRKEPGDEILFLIGPEGGFDVTELNEAIQYGFMPVSFCENRLRTETAAIAAASYMNLIRN